MHKQCDIWNTNHFTHALVVLFLIHTPRGDWASVKWVVFQMAQCSCILKQWVWMKKKSVLHTNWRGRERQTKGTKPSVGAVHLRHWVFLSLSLTHLFERMHITICHLKNSCFHARCRSIVSTWNEREKKSVARTGWACTCKQNQSCCRFSRVFSFNNLLSFNFSEEKQTVKCNDMTN